MTSAPGFPWAAFFGGLLVAGAFAAFTMTLGGPETAVTAVGIPIVAGAAGLLTALLRASLLTSPEVST